MLFVRGFEPFRCKMWSNREYGQRDPFNATLIDVSTFSASVMSAGTLRMPEFRCGEMSNARIEWTRWLRGIDNVFAAGEITDPLKKKQFLLAWGGLQLQDVFYGIPGADGSANDPDVYKTAVDALTRYFSPKQHETYERYKFWSLKIEPSETTGRFLHRVRQQASNCNFGDSAAKSREIGIIDKVIESAPPQLKEMLLQKEKLTLSGLEKAVNSFCAVKEQTVLMTSNDREIFVRKVRDKNEEHLEPKRECGNCGYKNHDTGDERCPALEARCRRCGHHGHFALKCRSLSGDRSDPSDVEQPSTSRGFRSVQQDSDEGSTDFSIGNRRWLSG